MVYLTPDYTENIIVFVVNNDVCNWYVTDKEIWYLDYKMRINAFKEKGFPVEEEYIDESRKNLLVLDRINVSIFLERIEKYATGTKELRELLIKNKNTEDDSWKFDFRPSLFVDFDTCRLYSFYSEPASYEEYVPVKWLGYYSDFFEFIPLEYRYWIDEKSTNLFGG